MEKCWIIRTEVNWNTDRKDSEFHRDELMAFDDVRPYNMHRGRIEKQMKMFNLHVVNGQKRMKCYKLDITYDNIMLDI